MAAIFESGSDGYRSFRIPVLLAARGGRLLAFAEGRKHGSHDHGEIHLVMRRSDDNGRTWGALQLVLTAADFGLPADATIGNPCPIYDAARGRIILLLTTNLGCDREYHILTGRSTGTREAWVTSSDETGAQWEAPRNITPSAKAAGWSWYATGPGAGVQTASGRLVAPCNHAELRRGIGPIIAAILHGGIKHLPICQGLVYNAVRWMAGGGFGYASHLIYSDDGGASWQIGGVGADDTNESAVAEAPDGSLLLNMRDFSLTHRRVVQRSVDRGGTLLPAEFDHELLDPQCQGSMLGVPPSTGPLDRGGLLFCNPSDAKARCNLTVRFRPWAAMDGPCVGGWSAKVVIDPGLAAYSSLALLAPLDTDDASTWEVGCLYEAGTTPTIRLARVALSEFAQRHL
jgi:sialidase-1